MFTYVYLHVYIYINVTCICTHTHTHTRTEREREKERERERHVGSTHLGDLGLGTARCGFNREEIPLTSHSAYQTPYTVHREHIL